MPKLVYGRIEDVPFYGPPGHADTQNRRLLGPFNGSNDVEVIIGEMGPSGSADTHTHDEFDQIAVMLEGELQVVTPDEDIIVRAGDYNMIPRGCEHTVYVREKARFVLLYSPPRQKL